MPEPVVLHVLEALTTGAARHVLDLVEHVEGHEHHVVVPVHHAPDRPDDPSIRRNLEALGAELHPVAMRRPPVDPRNGPSLVTLRRLARRIGASVVHGHSSIGGAIARGAFAGGLPVVYTPNGLAAGRAPRAIERMLGPLTARFVAVSASEAAEVRAGKLVRPDRLVTIPNGIDTTVPEPADLHATLGVPAGTRLVGTIGRLAPQKAPEVFVAAAAEIARAAPDVHFVMIGDGPLVPDVEAAVAAAGLGDRFHHVRFLEQASRYLPSLEVFTLTSRFEGGPYAPLEAMRASRPVVLTDVTGSRDTVEDGRTGFLVPPEAPSATAAAVLALLADPDRAAAIGRAGRAALEARFDVRTMAGANAALYEQFRAS